MVEIRTQRLIMRPPRQQDAEIVQTVLSNFEISKFLSRVDHPFPAGSAAEWITRDQGADTAANMNFALFDKTQNFCGMAGFDLDEETGLPELGYYLDTPYWGKGLMSEAVSAALGWLFANSSLPTVVSGAYTFNPASLAVQYKLGFKDVRTENRVCMAQKGEFPLQVTALDRQNFKPL